MFCDFVISICNIFSSDSQALCLVFPEKLALFVSWEWVRVSPPKNLQIAPHRLSEKHCQKQNGPEGWVILTI